MWWRNTHDIVEKYLQASTLKHKLNSSTKHLNNHISQLACIAEDVWLFCRLTHKLMGRCQVFSLSLDSYVLKEDMHTNALYAFSQLALDWGIVLDYQPNSDNEYIGFCGDIGVLDTLYVSDSDDILLKINGSCSVVDVIRILSTYDPLKDPLSRDLPVSIIIDDLYGTTDTDKLIKAYYNGALTNNSQHHSSEFASFVQEMVQIHIHFCTLCTKFFCSFEQLITKQCGKYLGQLDPEFLVKMSRLSNTELAMFSIVMLKCILTYRINEDYMYGSMNKMVDMLSKLELPD